MAGAGEEVKLLGLWASPFVIRARIAMNVKGIAYEFLEEVYGTKSELLLKSNPIYKKMPVLIHDGKPICESMIIVEYINDVWTTRGPSILSSDPYERATSRFWAFYVDDKLFPSMLVILKAKTEEAKVEGAEQVAAGLQLLEEAFEQSCKGKCFFGGENIGYLDIALGCLLGWIGVAEEICGIKLLDEEKVPKLATWATQFGSDDAVKEVIPEISKFAEFFGKNLLAKWNAAPTK